MLAAEPQPRIGHRRALVDGKEATTLTSSQILTGKFANHSLNPPVRDLYDFAVAGKSAPRALMIAVNAIVNALAGNEIRWRFVSWEMERQKFAEEGPLEFHDVPLQYEAIRADPTRYASQAVMAACTNTYGCTYTTARRSSKPGPNLANWFEQDGINALPSAAGIDPERIRDETGSAMRTGRNTVILELDQDRSAWGPYLPKMGEAPG